MDGELDTADALEESWTFIGDDKDPELQKIRQQWDHALSRGSTSRINIDSTLARRSVDIMNNGNGNGSLQSVKGIEPLRKGSVVR